MGALRALSKRKSFWNYLCEWNKKLALVSHRHALGLSNTACCRAFGQIGNHSDSFDVANHKQSVSVCKAYTLDRTLYSTTMKTSKELYRYCSLTSNTVAAVALWPIPSEPWLPIQIAISWTFGTVAETRTKRIESPRIFILEIITSSVLPRLSFKIWIWHTNKRYDWDFASEGHTSSTRNNFIWERWFMFSCLMRWKSALRYETRPCEWEYQLRVKLSHFSPCKVFKFRKFREWYHLEKDISHSCYTENRSSSRKAVER